MNTKSFRHLAAVALTAVALATAATSCSDPDIPAAPDTPATDPGDIPGVIRFSLASLSSRVTSDGLSSKFEPGDKIGCIISKRGNLSYQDDAGTWIQTTGFPDYHLATMWEVDKSGRYIILKKFKYANQNNPNDPDSNVWYNIEDKENDYITRLNLIDGYDYASNEFIYLKKSDLNYAFVFHYPLILNSELWDNLRQTSDSYDGSRPFYSYIEYPHCAQNEGLKFGQYGNGHEQDEYSIEPPWWPGAGFYASIRIFAAEMSKESIFDFEPSVSTPSNQWTHYGWNEYPVFVSTDQRNDKAYERSDFMSAVREYDSNGDPLNSNCEQTTLEVKFYKRHAAIEIESDFPIEDVRLYYSDTDRVIAWTENDYKWDGFIIGRKYDSRISRFSWMFPDKNPDYNKHQSDRSCINYIQRWPENMYPHQIGENHYRIILPPQPVPDTDDAGFLKFNDGESDRSIPLRKLLPIPAIEENKLYIIRLRRADVWSLEIRDWADGEDTDLEEITRIKA